MKEVKNSFEEGLELLRYYSENGFDTTTRYVFFYWVYGLCDFLKEEIDKGVDEKTALEATLNTIRCVLTSMKSSGFDIITAETDRKLLKEKTNVSMD